MRLEGVCATLAVIGVAPAWAGEAAGRAIAAAEELYRSADFVAAMKQVERARPLATASEEKVRIHLLAGILDEELAKPEDAKAEFLAALALNPEARFVVELSPKVRGAFEAVRKERARAAAASVARPIKLASPGLAVHNFTEESAGYYTDHIAQQFGFEGMQVLTPRQISAVLGLERQRAMLNCSESGCLAELANALGADAIIIGSIGKFENVFQLDIKIVSAADAQTLGLYSARVRGEAALLDECDKAVAQLVRQIVPKLRPGAAAASLERQDVPTESVSTGGAADGAHAWWWAPAVAGVVAAGVSTYLLVDSKGRYDALSQSGPGKDVPGDPTAYAKQGDTEQTIGVVLLGVGVAGLGAGAWLFLTGRNPGVTLAPLPGGASLGVQGQIP